MKKNNANFWIFLTVLIFGGIGVYLTFFASSTGNYDSQTKAYKITVRESYDSDDGTVYYPTYYYNVNGEEYECESKSGSSSYPNEKKNIVYYDSSNPSKCKTEYEKSTSGFAGIICIGVAVFVLVLAFLPKSKSSDVSNNSEVQEYNGNQQYNMNPETAQKVQQTAQKAQVLVEKGILIYKRIVIGIIILVLLFLTLFDTGILFQTLKSTGYIETTATLVEKKENSDSTVFDDYIYTFTDKKGNSQEIVVSVSTDSSPEQEIKIKYDEKNPQEFYEEGMTFTKSGIIWYIVKIVAIILLIILFFNKKLLSYIHIS